MTDSNKKCTFCDTILLRDDSENASDELCCPNCRKTYDSEQLASHNNDRAAHDPVHHSENSQAKASDSSAPPLESSKSIQQALPLGKKPPPASYALLEIAGISFFVFVVALGCYTVYKSFKGNSQQSESEFGIIFGFDNSYRPAYSNYSNSQGVKSKKDAGLAEEILNSQQFWSLVTLCATIFIGMAVRRNIKALIDIERASCRLAWRCGGLRSWLGLPPGGDLPYILPLTAAGGIMVMLSLSMYMSDPVSTSDDSFGQQSNMETVSWFYLFLSGIVIAFFGLGLGDLRRLFWRLGQTANLMTDADRGSELGWPANKRLTESKTRSYSHIYIYAMTIVSIIAFIFCLFIFMNQNQLNILGVFTVGIFGLIGGAYSCYLISRIWSETQQSWHKLTAKLHEAGTPGHGENAVTFLGFNGLIIGCTILAMCLLSIFLGSRGGGGGIVSFTMSFVVASIGCFVLWLRSLNIELFNFSQATSCFIGKRKKSTNKINTFIICLVACSVALLLGTLVEFCALGGSSAGSFNRMCISYWSQS